MDELYGKATPIMEDLQKIGEDSQRTGAQISKLNDQIKKAEKNPNASQDQIRKLQEARQKLEKSKEISDLSYQRKLNDKKTIAVFGSMRDRCQGLATNPSISGSTLWENCGGIFENNALKPSLQYMGVPEVKMPDWRYTPGKLNPFPDGRVPPKTGAAHGSPIQLPIIQAPGGWVPPVHGGPIPGQGEDDE